MDGSVLSVLKGFFCNCYATNVSVSKTPYNHGMSVTKWITIHYPECGLGNGQGSLPSDPAGGTFGPHIITQESPPSSRHDVWVKPSQPFESIRC